LEGYELVYTHPRRLSIDPSQDISANESLVSCGLLSNAPIEPKWAISIYLLEEFHSLRVKHRGRFPLLGFLQPIYDKLGLQLLGPYVNKFRLAYAAYIGILRTIERRQTNSENQDIDTDILLGPEDSASVRGKETS
jgi:hypothetical protein